MSFNFKEIKGKIKKTLKRWGLVLKHLILNPRFLLCFGIAWIVTNGWSYILLGLGILFDVTWMKTVSGAYVAFLWLPFTPEKIITFGLAMLFRKVLFPNDKKTEKALNDVKNADSNDTEEYVMLSVSDAIRRRSSTRGYTDKKLTASEIEALIHAGLRAPTAANRQEIHFTVLKGGSDILNEIENEKNRMRGLTGLDHNFYYEAPVVIILSADRTYRWSALDAGIAVENMALTAEEMGLGNLIIGCIYDVLRGSGREYFEKALKFPENYEYEIAIAFGHRAVSKEPHTYDAEQQVTYL